MRSMQHIRHFIWDFDGTLFDTYPVIIRNLRAALAQFGCDCDPVDCMRRMLVSIPVARDHYADAFGLDRAALAEAYEGFHRQANAELAAPPMDGAREVLQRIRDTGGSSYIFTHRKVWETRLYLEKHGLDGFFADILGPESEGFAAKPAPDAVLHLMQRHGMHPDDTVMIGDRDCDLGSGRNAGVGAVHLLCAVAPEELVCGWRLNALTDMLPLLGE